MMRCRGALLPVLGMCLAAACSAAAQIAPRAPEVIGMWEGESKCTVPGSPCKDEHVVYEIRAAEGGADKVSIDAYKIVSGARDFMGRLGCTYEAKQKVLRCIYQSRTRDEWEFHLSGNELRGTLVIGEEKQLYRRVRVTRVRATPKQP